jgi:hypothetical protein
MSCSRCGTRTNLWCLGCERVQYCGTRCQGSDWSRHASACGDGLIGAGSEGDDFIQMFPIDLFWRKLAEKKMTFQQFLHAIKRRTPAMIIHALRRVFDPLEMERVRDIFGITREQMEEQALTFAIDEDSDVMFGALAESGVGIRGRDLFKAVADGRINIIKLVLTFPGPGIQEIIFELIGEAARSNQEAVLRVLLGDERFDKKADKVVALKEVIDDDDYVLVVRLLLEDPQVRARFSKEDARKALENAPAAISKVLKDYIQA